MSLKGKTAIVTGSASGIGKSIALKYFLNGASVAVADLNIDGANQVVEEIKSQGGKAIALSMNVTDEKSVNEGVEKTIKELGGLDIMVPNAGIQIVNPIEEFSFDDWKKVTSIHGDGGFLTAKAAFTHMKKSKNGGKIIFMGSVHSHEASKLKCAYVYAKHGLIGLSRTLAKEGGPFGIYTYVICPGFVKTPLVEKQIPEQAKTLGISEEQVIKNVMLGNTVDGEFTTVDDIANLALFFANDSGALSGQSVISSHGWCMK